MRRAGRRGERGSAIISNMMSSLSCDLRSLIEPHQVIDDVTHRSSYSHSVVTVTTDVQSAQQPVPTHPRPRLTSHATIPNDFYLKAARFLQTEPVDH